MNTATMNGTSLISQEHLGSVVQLEARLKELSRVLDARKEGIFALLRAGVQVEEGELSAEIERKFSKILSWKVEFLKVMGPQAVKKLQDEAEPKLSEKLIIKGA